MLLAYYYCTFFFNFSNLLIKKKGNLLFFRVDGVQLERQYKEHLSGFEDWLQKPHAQEWVLFPENIGPRMSIDETSLSNGELYTILSNKDAKGRKGVLCAVIAGTKSETVETPYVKKE